MKIAGIAFVAAALVTFAVRAEDNIVIDGSTTLGPIVKAFAQYFMTANPDINITVSESGSGNGVKSLLNGKCDIASISRPLTPSEFEALAHNGNKPVAHAIALDGISILVHPGNPVQDLTVEQLRKIYLGEFTNWKQVGGPDKKIVPISRDTNSGTFETFEMKVMQGGNVRNDAENVNSNGAVRQRIQSTPAAVGYVGIGFVDRSVKAIKVNGIKPSIDTVKTGVYPIARPLYIYTNHYPELGSALYRYVTLHLTKDGQAMIEEIGFIPITEY